jgi:RNA-directed DNA polymerase
LDCLIYQKLRRWAKRRHPRKTWKWVSSKYWRLETGKWDFATKDGVRLYRHSRTPIVRHIKVKGSKSPYDGDWGYWASRLGRHPELPKRVAVLLKWQKGRCAHCGLYFRYDDQPEVDHIVPRVLGGKDGYINWQLVHRHCHDQKTAGDGSLAVRGTRDKRQTAEEPDEGKLSRPVLKTSRLGDQPA